MADRLRPVATEQLESRRAEERISRAVELHRDLIEHEILAAVSSLSADDFEVLSRVILESLGFDEVRQTGARWSHSLGDGGVDLEARMNQPGLPSLRVRAQAKRQQGNVGPGDIQRLRGALRAGEQGVFLTTSRFTKRAIEEAEADGKPPIGLVDGSAIARVMIDGGVAIRTRAIELPRFDLPALRLIVAEPGDEPS